jgi:hypothetical protein
MIPYGDGVVVDCFARSVHLPCRVAQGSRIGPSLNRESGCSCPPNRPSAPRYQPLAGGPRAPSRPRCCRPWRGLLPPACGIQPTDWVDFAKASFLRFSPVAARHVVPDRRHAPCTYTVTNRHRNHGLSGAHTEAVGFITDARSLVPAPDERHRLGTKTSSVIRNECELRQLRRQSAVQPR